MNTILTCNIFTTTISIYTVTMATSNKLLLTSPTPIYKIIYDLPYLSSCPVCHGCTLTCTADTSGTSCFLPYPHPHSYQPSPRSKYHCYCNHILGLSCHSQDGHFSYEMSLGGGTPQNRVRTLIHVSLHQLGPLRHPQRDFPFPL